MDATLWDKYPLLNTMMKLRKARFNASERLSKRYKLQSIALIVFSIYVLGLSIIPKYMPVPIDNKYDVIGFVTAFSSIFVVALSAYSAFSEDVVRSKYLHDNAKQVTNLYHEYKISIDDYENKDGPRPNNKEYEEKYKIIMDSCPYNHDQLDYQSIRSELEKLGKFEYILIYTQIALNLYFWPTIAFLAPPIMIAIGLRFLTP